MALVDEVGSGDHRRGLVALRDELAEAMGEASVGVKAQIAGQLRAVLAEIASLSEPEVSATDDIRAQREKRRAAAKVEAPASGRAVKRRTGSD